MGRTEKKSLDAALVNVTLEGISDLMFDRFYDHSGEDRPPERKLFLTEKDEAVIPAENIYSFLFRDMAPCGVVRYVEKNKAKDPIAIGQSHTSIEPVLIQIIDEKRKPIIFKGFGPDKKFYVNDWSAGLTKMAGGKVIKQEIRKRPVIRLPWVINFLVKLFPNDKITPDKLLTYFETGGLVTALGTYRPRYGRFRVIGWDVKHDWTVREEK